MTTSLDEMPATVSGHDQWRHALFFQMFELMHRYERDNFDALRYRGIDPNAFFVSQHVDYFDFFLHNSQHFFTARSLLADEHSRALYDQLLLFRILGHAHVRLPFNTPEALTFPERVDRWKVRDTADVGMFGPLAIYAVPTDDGEVRMKCWSGNVAASILFGQYFFYRDADSVAPEKGDTVIDAGGCFGDTALVFASTIGPKGRVHTFDPLKKHCKIMRDAFAMNPPLAPRIAIHEVGLADADSVGSAVSARDALIDPGARVAQGGDLPTRSIDSLVAEGAIDRIDYIKMDIEGSELAALRGGESALRKWRPRLAISLYHRPEDFFSIPLWLDGLRCGYRFFLDHYSIHHEETVLYARAAPTTA
jgi:FkbM family methyltransferase